MNLVVPGVGVEPGPAWANDINADLSILDGHNHSAGQGVQIQPNGININSDLPFNDNNATMLRSVRFSAQGSPIPNSGSDVGCLYVSGNEIYYNDVSGGNQVKITNNGSVNAGAGSISGLPSGTASASFSAGTFIWQSATNTAANMDARSYVFRNSSAGSKGLTLNPPNAMAADYSLTLPALPGSQSFMTVDVSGNMSGYASISGGLTGTNITSNVNLSGKSVQGNSHTIIVSNTNPASNGLSVIRGRVTFSGTTPSVASGEGFSIAFNAVSGLNTITFTTNFSDIPAIVVQPEQANSGDIIQWGTLALATSGFHLFIFSSSSPVARAYSFIATGIIA